MSCCLMLLWLLRRALDPGGPGVLTRFSLPCPTTNQAELPRARLSWFLLKRLANSQRGPGLALR
eukprot:scaffold256_cov261-Pinguiococcus_pyrenoidosus.AAC.21